MIAEALRKSRKFLGLIRGTAVNTIQELTLDQSDKNMLYYQRILAHIRPR